MSVFQLAYGDGRVSVDAGPMSLEVLRPGPAAQPPGDPKERPLNDPKERAPDPLERALDGPVGSPRLEDLARPGDRVLIVVSDGTRATAARRSLGALLRRLERAGVNRIELAIACGLHRQPDDAGVIRLIGSAHAQRLSRAAAGPWRDDDFADLPSKLPGIMASDAYTLRRVELE